MRVAACIVLAAFVAASGIAQLKSGDQAPAFSLPAACKDSLLSNPVSLASLCAKGAVVVAFYPADWSGGCTKEMCTFRDNFERLGSLGVAVCGISGDYAFSHREWARALSLPFLLLSDHDHATARAYASIAPGSHYNSRTVFLVDRSGAVVYADYAFKAGSDASFDALRAQVESLKAREAR
jgi:glutaredoxin-dependent peroxiredoxin